MTDPTEGIRRAMVEKINNNPNEREALEQEYGKDNVWNTTEVSQDFEIIGFMAPYVVAIKRSTGEKGTLMFQDNPRFYFGWRVS